MRCRWKNFVPPWSKRCAAILIRVMALPPHLESLTAYEREMLRKVADGESPGRIAANLKLAPSTVYSRLTRIREKLHLEDILQLAVWAATFREVLELDEDILFSSA